MSQTQIFPFAIGEVTVMVIVDGRPRAFRLDTEQGKKLAAAVQKRPQNEDEIRSLADVTSFITKHTFGRVTVDDRDQLRLDGVVVDYGMAGVIIRLCNEGADPSSLTNFLINVSANPNKDIADDLYAFISKGMLPITPEGHFLAFKRVSSTYMDIHSNTVSYKKGETPSMDRALCDLDRNRTCSRGLHACSYEYLPHFGGSTGHIMIVKINPTDVTAIPTDYNQTKLRCCKMEVVDEVPEAEVKAHFNKTVDTRYSPTAEDAIPDDDATAADGVVSTPATQKGPLTIEEVRDWATEDGQELANIGNDCVIGDGSRYEEGIDRFCITYPIYVVEGFLSEFELDEYHSTKAHDEGAEDAKKAFDQNLDVEHSFDWTNGDRFGDIPGDQEEVYMHGYLEAMLALQQTAHPDA
jgi:hypothetical protein